MLRPGNAGSGNAADHVTLLDAALAQLPVDPAAVEVLARADSAGMSHGFLDACRARQVRFVVGHRLTQDLASILVTVPAVSDQPESRSAIIESRSGVGSWLALVRLAGGGSSWVGGGDLEAVVVA